MAIVFRRDYIAMALASHFQTFSLCPGHTNPGILAPDSVVVTDNPVTFIDDFELLDDYFVAENFFRINVPESKILPLIWNMKEWNVSVNCRLVTYERQAATPEFDVPEREYIRSFSGELTGKFLFCEIREYQNFNFAASTNKEPALKVDGWLDAINFDLETGEKNSFDYHGTSLLPSFHIHTKWQQEGARSTYQEIKDHENNNSGMFNCTTTVSYENEPDDAGYVEYHTDHRCFFYVAQLFLKGDGTVDVLCAIQLGEEYAQGFKLVQEAISPNGAAYDFEPVTFTFLGESVSAFMTIPLEGREIEYSLLDFDLSYDVTVQEEWTY